MLFKSSLACRTVRRDTAVLTAGRIQMLSGPMLFTTMVSDLLRCVIPGFNLPSSPWSSQD